ncbi:MAG: T9SS type A sorting domain-containing protein, partial [Proteobacteria bacterium]
YDVSGRLVRTIGSGFDRIDVSDLVNGNYLVKVTVGGNEIETLRLFKN